MLEPLQPHATIPKAPGPVMVCILDGWGENPIKDQYNAVYSAKTPFTDGLRANAERWRTIKAHGKAVGLPSDADMGNSEVGHNALGSGQVIDQGARLVDIALETGKMFEMPGWQYISEAFAEHTLHFIGLLSDGGVHSRYDQLAGCMKGAAERGAKRIRVHILTDGRDVPDGSSIQFIAGLEKDLEELRGKGCDAKIASGEFPAGCAASLRHAWSVKILAITPTIRLATRGCRHPRCVLMPYPLLLAGGGRMYVTMDRYDADWSIVKRGWDAHVLGEAPHKFKDATTAVTTLRAGGKTDQVRPRRMQRCVHASLPSFSYF